MVRTVAISCIRDEVDIVEPFVRHTLSHVDRLVILDNGSADGTRHLLQALIDEGLPLDVVDDPSPGHYQWRRMTHLMRAHALEKHAADWIVPLDVDEFLTVDDLPAMLQAESDGRYPIAIPWRSYVPAVDDDPGEINPVLRIRHCLRDEARTTIKVIIPSRLASIPAATIAQGNHSLEGSGRTFTASVAVGAFLGHFPGRSVAQFARKVAVKHLQYLAMGEKSPDWGSHYRVAVELLRKDLSHLEADFHRTILFYNLPDGINFQPVLIAAPIAYKGGPLKYTPAQSQRSLIESMLECAEMFARGHGLLAKVHDSLIADSRQKEAALLKIYQSPSWRIGQTVTGPVRWIKQGLRTVRNEYRELAADISRKTRRAA